MVDDDQAAHVVIIDLQTFLNHDGTFTKLNQKLLIIGRHYTPRHVKLLMDQGIKGCLLYTCGRDEIIKAIHTVAQGQRFYCAEVLNIITQRPPEALQDLSQRELEVMELIVKGISSNNIAEKLSVSIHTVNSHRKNILSKLNLRSPTQLIIYAIENGLIEPEI